MTKDQKIAARRIIDDMIEHCSILLGDFQALRVLYPDVFSSYDMQQFHSMLQNTLLPGSQSGIQLLRMLSDTLTQEIKKGIEE